MRTTSDTLVTESFVSALYERYAEGLRRVRQEQRELYDRHRRAGGRAQLDDLEAEISYLLVRHTRPAALVEIGCLHGWSTSWLLRALRDNREGTLYSFDRTGAARRWVPPELSEGRWLFTEGDVRERVAELPDDIGYLFLDAAHSARFARWYLRTLLPRLAPGTVVSVHDVHHRARPLPGTEGAELLRWLCTAGITSFTVAAAKAPDVNARLRRLRVELGLAEPVHSGADDPMVFFTTPHPAGHSGPSLAEPAAAPGRVGHAEPR
ncbi:class I SAM-dependent methyltransferase [Actinopolymorpha sp. NPDC004070]|uniref:class I SAM-dependent methyltransferase n=1 Tax=Actinopolymorpha sp. NPDC004070 TaxID=3154548 RepID=UPI0033A2C5DE